MAITRSLRPIFLIATSGALLLAQSPSFRVATRLIQVNVIVTDHRGDPVTGLTKNDFEILDQGRPQKIGVFAEQTKQARPAASETAGAPLVFSNHPDENIGASYGSATVILFDRLNTPFLDSAFARERLAKFLSGVRPDDRIALYGLSSSLVVLHDFTEDASALLRALDRYKPLESNATRATTFQETHSGFGVIDWFENRANQKESDTLMTGRVGDTAAALTAIANHLAGLPGRKNLVWVSAAFPISIGYFQQRIRGTSPTRNSFDAQVEAAARALSNANVAIYPVDAHVLGTLGGVYDSSKAPKPGVRQLQQTLPMPEEIGPEELASMTTLAVTTGGRVFANGNDLGGAVRRAIDDSRSTYMLGYYPDHEKWDGEFREIKVKLKRAGLEARYRRGYLAVAETAQAVASAPVSIKDVINRPLESGELGLSVQIEKLGGREFKMHLRIDASSMQFEQKDGKWTGALEVLWVQYAPDGSEVTGHGQTLNFRLTPETYEANARDGLKIVSTEAIDEKAAQLRFAARDPGTGAVGSLHIPVRRLIEP
jgi:VWFA-related protein